MEKTYLINKLSNYTLSFYRGKSIIVRQNNNKEFIQIPSRILLATNEKLVTFSSEEEFKNEFSQFIFILETFLSSEKKHTFIKRIKISGLGYKILKEDINLNLNLGYSKPVQMKIPNQVSNIIIKKNMIVLESSDKVFLGNFVSNLCSLKKRDIYKGKGLSLEYNNVKLKAIKKK